MFTRPACRKSQTQQQDDIAAWLVKPGVDKTKFLEFYNSFSVAGKAGRATQISRGLPGGRCARPGCGGQILHIRFTGQVDG